MPIKRLIILFLLASLTCAFLGIAIVNLYAGDRYVEQDPAALATADDTVGISEPVSGVDLIVEQSGVVAVSSKQLQAAGLRPDTFTADNLQLTRAGKAVPVLLEGSGEQAVLYFYAIAVTDTMAGPAVYRLKLGKGTVMRSREAAPTGPGDPDGWHHRRWEENSHFVADTGGDDLWLGPLLFAPAAWQLDLGRLYPGMSPAQLKVRVWSNTDDPVEPDHHIALTLNGWAIDDWYWEGIKQETAHFSLDPALFHEEKPNVLTIGVPGDTGAVGESHYIDWIELSYQAPNVAAEGQLQFDSDAANIVVAEAGEDHLFFDVTHGRDPVHLNGVALDGGNAHFSGREGFGRYIALGPKGAVRPTIRSAPQWQTSLLGPEQGADYVAIVADVKGYVEALQPLLAHRRQQGLTVTVVPLAQIYDEFGHAERNPEAIRDFLSYAAQSWHPAPRYVLLVGDAAIAVRNQAGTGSDRLLPTRFFKTSGSGYLASDAWYARSDPMTAAMMIGRFPVQTPSQLVIIVNKTIAYENGAGDETAWHRRALVVSDDEAQFDSAAAKLSLQLTREGYGVHSLQMSQKENIHYDIIGALNQGVGLVNYVGNGDAQTWGDEEVFETDDVAMLNHSGRVPIFATFTCGNGAFADPGTVSLIESLLWSADGGIVAAVAPSGRHQTRNPLVLPGLFTESLLNRSAETLGQVMAAMGNAAQDNLQLQDLVMTTNLLGDPALRIHRP